MKKTSSGFSLVELMIAAGILGGLSLGVMQILKNSNKGQVDIQNFADYNSMRDEISFVLSTPNSCKASLSGFTFNGQSIKSTPKSGVELWSANQVGDRATKKFYSNAVFGKLEIESIALSMPDYTAGVNWVEGKDQSFNAVITVSGKKSSMGTKKSFNDIAKSIMVTFDTNSSGLSTIKDCSFASNGNGGSSAQFTIWGNNTCPAGYETLKSGRIFGSSLKGNGNAATDIVCSSTPKIRKIYANPEQSGYKWVDPMSCAICAPAQARICFTNYGTNSCPAGFKQVYSGKMFQAAWANYGTSGKLLCKEGSTNVGLYVVNEATTKYEWINGEDCSECCRD